MVLLVGASGGGIYIEALTVHIIYFTILLSIVSVEEMVALLVGLQEVVSTLKLLLLILVVCIVMT